MNLLPLVERAARHALNASGLASRWIETSVAQQHVYDARGGGDLPTVVVLHGISSAATPFGPFLRRLHPAVRRVLAPDAPAHGFSGAPRVPLTPKALFGAMVELLDQELDEPAILVGNSMGGGVALHYAMNRPERVRGIFLASPAGAPMEPDAFKRFLQRFDLQSKADARTFMNRLYHKTPWFAPLIAGDVHRLFDREPIKMPVHLVWGRSERLMPEENLLFFKKHLPANATIEEPEGFGHCPHLDAPGRLARKVLDFARRITNAS
jgi:pimeloyl-ACP methyl ester carboxylesterase